eukprot:gene5195-5433_t
MSRLLSPLNNDKRGKEGPELQVFYDLKCSRTSKLLSNFCSANDGNPGAADSSQEWLELVIKAETFGTDQDVKDLRDRVKLGDSVAVSGWFEESHVLLVQQLTVIRPWRGQQAAVLQQPSIRRAANDASQHPDPSAIAAVQPPQLAVCKFWVNTGRCAKGAACPYAHLQSGVLPAARNTWLKQHKGRRQLLSSFQGFGHTDSAASKQHRARRFAAWLVQTYGRDRLNSGSGVLDIADQATEAILQYAVSKGKPFAIVPCCVFPRLFPHRQLAAEGHQAAQRVETYSQLVQYLQQEGQGQLHTLDVEGANIVVFRQ